jgi:hypothetical protein
MHCAARCIHYRQKNSSPLLALLLLLLLLLLGGSESCPCFLLLSLLTCSFSRSAAEYAMISTKLCQHATTYRQLNSSRRLLM